MLIILSKKTEQILLLQVAITLPLPWIYQNYYSRQLYVIILEYICKIGQIE